MKKKAYEQTTLSNNMIKFKVPVYNILIILISEN